MAPPKRTTTVKFSSQSFVHAHSRETLSELYEIDFDNDKIEEGSKSVIYKCIHKQTGSERAVKIIQKSSCDEVENEKIRNEFCLLKSMEHPSILKVYESFETKDKFFIVADYCKGGELREVIFRNGGLTEHYTAAMVKTILTGINYAFRNHSLCHLGLKPENILLPADRDIEGLKIIDFGNSLTAPKNGFLVAPKTKKLNRLVGNAAYMAPENVQYQSYSHKSDTWACGVIAYSALAGCLPFQGADDKETLELVMNSKDDVAKKELFKEPVWEGVSPEAIDFIANMLSYQQWKRPSAKQALEHPWIQRVAKSQAEVIHIRDTDIASEAAHTMLGFSAPGKLQQAVLMYMVSHLVGKDDTDSIARVFQAMDVSSTGRLTQDDFYKGLSRILADEYDLTVDEADGVFRRIDFNGSGSIEYSEFLVAALSGAKLFQETTMENAFRAFDRDDSGSITSSDIMDMLGLQGSALRTYVSEKVLNGEEGLTYETFASLLQDTKLSPVKKQ